MKQSMAELEMLVDESVEVEIESDGEEIRKVVKTEPINLSALAELRRESSY